MNSERILLVDDDRNFLRVLGYQVQEFGYDTCCVSSGVRALERVQESDVDLVVTDLRMPGMDGLQLLERIRRLDPDLPVIVLTAHGSIEGAVDAVKGGASDFLTKPFEREEIHHSIRKALQMTELIRENRRLSREVQRRFEFEGIVGSSKEFREVLDMARQLAPVGTTVLIQGETGTGKELLARAIHFNGPRQDHPFVVVNCGAIPRDLMESELFGHRKGAFTGAIADRRGKFAAADSGTLFLDEVAELPLDMQVKLLRVLQQKEMDVIGDPEPSPVDVRILAATNQDLGRALAQGRFRQDLFYRLSVAPLSIPPLRERREDVPLLIHHFQNESSRKLGKEVRIGEEAVSLLQSYRWPGNVRELENVVERLVLFNQTGNVEREDLPIEIRRPPGDSGGRMFRLPEKGFSLQELERDILLAALERNRWNQVRTARYLGITRNTLIYRMRKFGLRRLKGEGRPPT